MTNEATPKQHKVVRFPIYDKNTNQELHEFLEIDVETFFEGPRGLARRCRIVEFPDPTPEQEIDIIDRIIHGLPVNAIAIPHPSHEGIADIVEEYMEEKGKELQGNLHDLGVKLYDVASLHPVELNAWTRIPEFDNYEVNPLGMVRSRWTKRELEVATIGDEKSVEMHDKDGFSHEVNIRLIMEWTFGKNVEM